MDVQRGSDGDAPDLRLAVSYRDDHCVAQVGGVVDAATTSRLVAGLAHPIATGVRLLVVDLSEVSVFGSAGVSALMSVRAMARVDGCRLRLACCPPTVARVVALAALRPFRSVAEALAARPVPPPRA
ncbi:STAS domain-containing protein [Actinosynnema sp. NPDC020468]|uniref:STAS domain-containing protein n=1 Tax=Actinosynnema sp. NPDC020468 TaxID=3154488 RepID=UPI0034061092